MNLYILKLSPFGSLGPNEIIESWFSDVLFPALRESFSVSSYTDETLRDLGSYPIDIPSRKFISILIEKIESLYLLFFKILYIYLDYHINSLGFILFLIRSEWRKHAVFSYCRFGQKQPLDEFLDSIKSFTSLSQSDVFPYLIASGTLLSCGKEFIPLLSREYCQSVFPVEREQFKVISCISDTS